MSTDAVAAKMLIRDRLRAHTGPGGQLEGVSVEYAYRGDMAARCIYGGGFRFTQTPATAELRHVVIEQIRLAWYVRVTLRPPGDVADSDVEALRIGNALASVLTAEPTLVDPTGGAYRFAGIAGGQGDYHGTDDETVSMLAYELLVESKLTHGVSAWPT